MKIFVEKVFGKNYEQVYLFQSIYTRSKYIVYYILSVVKLKPHDSLKMCSSFVSFYFLFLILANIIKTQQMKTEINGRKKNVCFEIQSVSARDTLKCQTIHDDDIFRG